MTVSCCRLHPAESEWFVAEDENKCIDYSSPVEKKGWYSYPLKMRVLQLLFSRGEHPEPCLDRLLLFLSGLTWKKDLLSITQNVVVYILVTIKETKITNAEGKGGQLITLRPWENSYRLWKLP